MTQALFWAAVLSGTAALLSLWTRADQDPQDPNEVE